MGHVLHIVASCAQTKSIAVPRELQLRAIPCTNVEERVGAWLRRLKQTDVPTATALQLYSGTYWANVRRLLQSASQQGYDAELWIASAGYGLVRSTTLLKPYSATFATGSPDSVWHSGPSHIPRRHALTSWWAGLTGGPRTRPGPRSLKGLARLNPRGSILLLCGPAYVQAMSDDLAACAQSLDRPQRLVIVTSNERVVPNGLAGNVACSDARFAHKLGGALATLHARVAAHLLEEAHGSPLDSSSLRSYAAAIADAQPEWKTPSRDRGTDSHVESFIRGYLRREARPSYTAGLRKYRSVGQACEQKRFKALFQTVAKDHHAS